MVRVFPVPVAIANRQAPGFLEHKSVPIVFEQLQLEQPDIAASLLMGLVAELDRFNLMHRASSPGIRTPDYSNYSLEVTPLGARFVKHLTPEA